MNPLDLSTQCRTKETGKVYGIYLYINTSSTFCYTKLIALSNIRETKREYKAQRENKDRRLPHLQLYSRKELSKSPPPRKRGN